METEGGGPGPGAGGFGGFPVGGDQGRGGMTGVHCGVQADRERGRGLLVVAPAPAPAASPVSW